MSVLSEIITAITNTGLTCYEGLVDQILEEKPKYNRFVTIVEEEAEFDEDSMDGTHLALGDFKLTIQTYIKKPSTSESWSAARTDRDLVISTIQSKKYNSRDVLLTRWNRLDRDNDQQDAGYQISVHYMQVHS